jgi:hypothetical protein
VIEMTPWVLTHVVISLVGIASGFVVIFGFLTSRRLDGWTAFFLLTTVLTSLTGFVLPAHKFMPSHVVGILSLVAFTLAILGRYRFHLHGEWRKTYVVTAVIAQYFNVFVLVFQLFEKVPALKAVAPTQSEPPLQLHSSWFWPSLSCSEYSRSTGSAMGRRGKQRRVHSHARD